MPCPDDPGTFQIYSLDRGPTPGVFKARGSGRGLVDFLEGVLKGTGGRMILADTSSIAEYEKTVGFTGRKDSGKVARVLII